MSANQMQPCKIDYVFWGFQGNVILKIQVFYMVLGVILMLTGFTFLLYMWILAVIEIKNKINALNRRIKDWIRYQLQFFMISKGLARNKFLSCARDGNYCYHSRKDLEDENAMKIKAIQEYYERNCEKHGNGKVMATVI